MIILGLTGSIGMGKSTTATLFAEAGVPVYDADATVHMIYEGEAVPAIEAAFPGTTNGGKVDRHKLSAQVVHDPAAIRRLEQIVHPMLRAYHQKFLHDAETSGAPVAVVDVPLLYETGGEKRVDAVVVVTTSLAVLEELVGSTSVQVRLTGGAYRRSSHDLSGNAVIDALGGINADKVFFGAAALSFRKGVMNYDPEMPKAFLRAGRERILVIDSSKIGTEAVYRLCAAEKCDLVITDEGAKPADLVRLRKLTSVTVAK